MRLTNLEEIVVDIPVPKPGLKPAWTPGITLTSSTVPIVKITTEDGLEGYGVGTALGENISQFLEKIPISLILGWIGEPFGVEKIMKILRIAAKIGPRPYVIEMALWDLIGKICKQPVYKLLGGFKDKVKAYCSTAELKSTKKMVKDAQDAVEMGFKGIKLRARRTNISKDIEVVKAVRDAVGDDIEIMVDANQAWGHLPPFWSVKTAIEFGKALDKIDAAWLEEPLHEENTEGIKKLRKTIETPVAGGEIGNDIFFYRDLLVNDVYDIVQADVTFSGGILECRKIAGLCEAFCKELIPHAWNNGLAIAATLQLIGAIPNCSWLEYPYAPPCWTPEVRDAILMEPILINKRGYVEIPKGPGLGVELNWEVIEEYRIK
ncbi:MAG: mandelate racemase/muconate lactonizing enzyme family protein [Candidatus Helarchaeota archaeon]|nr:mandelate racemase/muconate lactonizing enzyme family protein [Candidatus Helarchaeota archaeon]